MDCFSLMVLFISGFFPIYIHLWCLNTHLPPPPPVFVYPGDAGALLRRWQQYPAGTATALLLLIFQLLKKPCGRQRLARAPAARVLIAASWHSLLMWSTISFLATGVSNKNMISKPPLPGIHPTPSLISLAPRTVTKPVIISHFNCISTSPKNLPCEIIYMFSIAQK